MSSSTSMGSSRLPERVLLVVRGSSYTGAILVVIALLVATLGSPSQQRIGITFFVNVVLVLGLQVFMGNSGVTNFGFVAFAGIGAYTTAILTVPVVTKGILIPDAPLGLSSVQVGVFVGVLAAIVVTGLIGYVSGLALTTQSGIAIEIATLALLVIVHVTLTNWVALTGGARAFYGIPLRTTVPLAAGGAVAVAIVVRWFKESETGLLLRAAREDGVAASAMGVLVQKVRLVAWVLGAAVIGFGGAMDAHFLGTIDPDTFYLRVTFLILAMLLLGGQRTVSGPIVGAVLITFAWEVMRMLEDGPTLVGIDLPQVFGLPVLFLGLLIMIVMKFRPEGLLGDVEVEDWVAGLVRRIRPDGTDSAPSSRTDVTVSAATHTDDQATFPADKQSLEGADRSHADPP